MKWCNDLEVENSLVAASCSKFDPGILRGVK